MAAVRKALEQLDHNLGGVTDIVNLEDGIGFLRALIRFRGTFAAILSLFLSASTYVKLTVVLAIAIAAMIIPISRAFRSDPVAALRCE